MMAVQRHAAAKHPPACLPFAPHPHSPSRRTVHGVQLAAPPGLRHCRQRGGCVGDAPVCKLAHVGPQPLLRVGGWVGGWGWEGWRGCWCTSCRGMHASAQPGRRAMQRSVSPPPTWPLGLHPIYLPPLFPAHRTPSPPRTHTPCRRTAPAGRRAGARCTRRPARRAPWQCTPRPGRRRRPQRGPCRG